MKLLFCPLIFLIVVPLATGQTQHRAGGERSKSVDDSQLYRNSTFAFRYRIPYGWVDRTKEMQAQGEQKQDDAAKPEAGKGEVLLAVFERPPQAAGDTVNSAVVIASESGTSYPGLKSAEDYLGPLNELTASKGLKPEGEPQEVTIDSRSLIRADFTKTLNEKLAMYQSTLVIFEKKQIVSFTFIAGSKDEIDDLMDGLSFPSSGARKRP